MINISGANDTAEYAAALALQSRIITTWPDVVNRADHRIALVAAAKCYGQRICDIDIPPTFA
jgi:hypothetical protein